MTHIGGGELEDRRVDIGTGGFKLGQLLGVPFTIGQGFGENGGFVVTPITPRGRISSSRLPVSIRSRDKSSSQMDTPASASACKRAFMFLLNVCRQRPDYRPGRPDRWDVRGTAPIPPGWRHPGSTREPPAPRHRR